MRGRSGRILNVGTVTDKRRELFDMTGLHAWTEHYMNIDKHLDRSLPVLIGLTGVTTLT